MKSNLTFVFLLTLSISAFAQQKQADSLSIKPLSEVVVTAQIQPQSLKKSVHHVRVITKADIKQLAANNLADVLNQYLNISIRNSGSDGRSTVSMFGLDAQYFKILVDNVPLVSDTGLGTDTDLTQVSLDDIEQIEIIEGSMGVTHGANAVSGILNIITRKKASRNWEISATAQEETVSKEFALFDKGRHIQSVKVSHQLENWFVSIGGNRNDFAGFFNGRKGKDYAVNDGLRGYSWLPKEQLSGNAAVSYAKHGLQLFYKFDYFGETVAFYNPVLNPQDHYPFPETYYARDRRYWSSRYFQHLNAVGKLFSKLDFNASVSWQRQQRDLEKFNYQLETGQESLNDRQTYQSKEIFYATGTLGNFFPDKKAGLQIGYEFVNEKGFYDASAGMFRDYQQQAQDVRKRFENYDVFAVSEINVTPEFSVRPGIRYSFQSRFEDQYAGSLGLRYLFKKAVQARISVGRSYRMPNFDELYTYFVDSNHNLQGNPDLKPEKSVSYELNLQKTTDFGAEAKLSNDLSLTFLNIDDRISLVLEQLAPMQQYRYLNIDSYKTWNLAFSHELSYHNLKVRLGAALVGISQKIDLAALQVTSDDQYLYALQLNSSVSYQVSKWQTVFSAYYKFNGKQQQYVSVTDAGNNAGFALSELDSYSWMDASASKTFFKKRFEVTAGARNLFNVTNLQSRQSATTGIHAADTNTQLGYGRSYFLKITYNLNFN